MSGQVDPFAGCTWLDDRGVEVMNVSQARRILADREVNARAEVEAVKARVRALADEWERERDGALASIEDGTAWSVERSSDIADYCNRAAVSIRAALAAADGQEVEG